VADLHSAKSPHKADIAKVPTLLFGGREGGDDVDNRDIGAATPDAGDCLPNNEGVHGRRSGSEGRAEGEEKSANKKYLFIIEERKQFSPDRISFQPFFDCRVKSEYQKRHDPPRPRE